MNRRRRLVVLPLSRPTPGDLTEDQRLVLAACETTPSPGGGLCLAWVGDVFENALGLIVRRVSAYEDWQATTTHMNYNIPAGAVVYGTGQDSEGNGHIGIYIGGGMVMDNQGPFGDAGRIVTSTIESWVSWQTDTIDGHRGYLGWGWYGDRSLV